MFAELDVVALVHNIKKHSLSKGSRGTIVQLYENSNSFAVEFVDDEGYTIALIDLTPKDVCLIWSRTMRVEILSDTKNKTKDKVKEYRVGNRFGRLYLNPEQASRSTQRFAF